MIGSPKAAAILIIKVSYPSSGVIIGNSPFHIILLIDYSPLNVLLNVDFISSRSFCIFVSVCGTFSHALVTEFQ
jgi:hypothetical protein